MRHEHDFILMLEVSQNYNRIKRESFKRSYSDGESVLPIILLCGRFNKKKVDLHPHDKPDVSIIHIKNEKCEMRCEALPA